MFLTWIGDIAAHWQGTADYATSAMVNENSASKDCSFAATLRESSHPEQAIAPSDEVALDAHRPAEVADIQPLTQSRVPAAIQPTRNKNVPSTDRDRHRKVTESAPEQAAHHAKDLEYEDLAKYFHLPITAGTLVYSSSSSFV